MLNMGIEYGPLQSMGSVWAYAKYGFSVGPCKIVDIL
jgi:hypothetical protein